MIILPKLFYAFYDSSLPKKPSKAPTLSSKIGIKLKMLNPMRTRIMMATNAISPAPICGFEVTIPAPTKAIIGRPTL
jgi:hypothetical protein